jgi:hypothetical protein
VRLEVQTGLELVGNYFIVRPVTISERGKHTTNCNKVP